MPATTNVNFRTVVHASSNGTLITFPDVCKTPTPAGPVPIPYPNTAMSSNTANGTKTVKIDGNPVMVKGANFPESTGDEAGSAGGVASNIIKGKAEFILYSFDVKCDGKNVCRLADLMFSNKQSSPNTPPMPEVQPPLVIIDLPTPPTSKDKEEEKDWDLVEMKVLQEEPEEE